MSIRALLILSLFSLSAYAQDQSGPAGSPSQGLSQMLVMFAMVAAVWYFLLIRPQQKQKKEHEDKINALSKGDKIVTAGGIVGNIIGIKENIAVIKTAENTKLEVLKSSISQVLGKEE